MEVADPRTHASEYERASWNRTVSFRFEHPDKAQAGAIAARLRRWGVQAESHHFAVTVSFPELRDDRLEAAGEHIVRMESLLARLGEWRPSWVTISA